MNGLAEMICMKQRATGIFVLSVFGNDWGRWTGKVRAFFFRPCSSGSFLAMRSVAFAVANTPPSSIEFAHPMNDYGSGFETSGEFWHRTIVTLRLEDAVLARPCPAPACQSRPGTRS